MKWELFNKNIGFCEVNRQCIKSDACPVLEAEQILCLQYF